MNEEKKRCEPIGKRRVESLFLLPPPPPPPSAFMEHNAEVVFPNDHFFKLNEEERKYYDLDRQERKTDFDMLPIALP